MSNTAALHVSTDQLHRYCGSSTSQTLW